VVEYDPFLFYEDPYPIYRRLRDEAAVYLNRERSIWVRARRPPDASARRSRGRGADRIRRPVHPRAEYEIVGPVERHFTFLERGIARLPAEVQGSA
jgi:hypothetical protein